MAKVLNNWLPDWEILKSILFSNARISCDTWGHGESNRGLSVGQPHLPGADIHFLEAKLLYND